MAKEIVSDIVKKHWDLLAKRPNVLGYSAKLQPRERNGIFIPNTKVFRVYVTKKLPESSLKRTSVIPSILSLSGGNIETDVVEIGKVSAPPPSASIGSSRAKEMVVDKTARLRPVPLGVSVSNWNVTSGSLGILYRTNPVNKIGFEGGVLLAGSNAHVLCSDDLSKEPSEVAERKILQPGSYFGGKTEDNVVGYYVFHQKIFPDDILSSCAITNAIAKIFNRLSDIFNRHTRLKAMSVGENHLDFAVYQPTTEHVDKLADGCLTDEPFIGHLFAGSKEVGIVSKAKYIVDLGLEPLVPVAEVKVGDIVKGCSFWCHCTTTVFDDSGVITVSYGDWDATFKDVIIIVNDGSVKGGWSGSGFRLISD